MATISEDYVSFETAKLLKEKGFHEKVNYVYHYYTSAPFYQRHLRDFNGEDYKNLRHEHYSAPTLQMAMKWLREVHGLFISIGNDDLNWCWQILDINHRDENLDPKVMSDSYGCNDSYEEAVSNGLVYCLENLI
jgi:hypothetical protein